MSADEPMSGSLPEHYPEESVVAVVENGDAGRVIGALRSAGFRQSEIRAVAGQMAADKLRAQTGRTGLADLAIRIAQRLHLTDEELEMKEEYSDALRDGKVLFLVLAPTAERKELAAQLLHSHGASSVNFLGRYTIIDMTGSGPTDPKLEV